MSRKNEFLGRFIDKRTRFTEYLPFGHSIFFKYNTLGRIFKSQISAISREIKVLSSNLGLVLA
jgi:hypothetical protein